MIVREIRESEKDLYNKTVGHIIQSWQWGEFRKSAGLDLVRLGHFEGNKLISAYQLTFHPVPFFKKNIGYLPKGPLPDRDMVRALVDLGKKKNAAYIKIEPNVIVANEKNHASYKLVELGLVPSKKSLFTKYNFIVDLSKSNEELLAGFSQKTRYNIGLAQRKGVEVYESQTDTDFEIYLKLYFETTKRQKYFGHTPEYHRRAWKVLKDAGLARVLIAKYQGKPLVAWMLFNFGETLYYPYGGSSTEHRDVMASNLVCFEAIALGKRLGLKHFDMWGALGPDADPKDPWYGFHKFKLGYGSKLVEYVGTYDLIVNAVVYNSLNLADMVRWKLLRLSRK